jgi:hypothetical protein
MGRIDEDLYINGNLSAKSMSIPASGVGDAQVAAGANLSASKLQHRDRFVFGQSGAAASATAPIRVAVATTPLSSTDTPTARVVSVRAGSITPCTGNATITVDVQKGGASMLTGVITLDASNSARVAEEGVLADGDLETGDWVDLVVVATVGTGALGTGLLVEVEIDETAQ